jgi:ubiquitin carboxyl-terminal hydrolase 8
VPIPNNLLRQPNLEQCVQEFTKEEILDNEDKWNCPRCRSQQRAKKKIDIWKLPSILIVHLKRFEFSETKKGKIKDYVDFPIKNLDLTPNVSKLQRDKPIYDLFAVCNHEGFLGGGHYYAYTKHRHNQSWYQFNDEIVTLIKKESDIVSADAYILFYSKMSVDEFCRQTLSEPGLWPHIIKEIKKTNQIVIEKKPTAKIDISSAFNQQ